MLSATDHDREQGFTLVEVLVALLILALASGAAFRAISGGATVSGRARGERDAVMFAESRLAQIGHLAAVQPGHMAGIDNGLDWTIDIGDQLADPPPASGLAAYPVRVAVHWRDGRRLQELHLDSVRLGPPQAVDP